MLSLAVLGTGIERLIATHRMTNLLIVEYLVKKKGL